MYYEFTINYQYRDFDRSCTFTTYAENVDEALDQFFAEPQGRLKEHFKILDITKHHTPYVDETEEIELEDLISKQDILKTMYNNVIMNSVAVTEVECAKHVLCTECKYNDFCTARTRFLATISKLYTGEDLL